MTQQGVIGRDIKKAADILRTGGVVVYPTETVYGIGANIFSENALEKVFSIKGRKKDKPISIAVSGFEMMDTLAYISDKEREFIRKFLPGPVTVLLKKKISVPESLSSGDLVGIRYPDHDAAVRLLELAGVPITSTSANLSGEAPPHRVDDIKLSADYILDGGECNAQPSTVVDLINRKIVRKGAKFEEVVAALGEL
ncbi:MAG: threonylcarbamoyl-AMP synthase [Candidatus Methanoperedens sp.]|nr:threonylcarbamoyl-AMP synthase [Candidatus Methanoperedens sp.]